jgi:hypothetical protein
VFGDRLITDKEKMVNELNQLNEVIGRLERENQELRAMERQNQEERKKAAAAKSSAWFGVFGGGAGAGESSSSSLPPASPIWEEDDDNNKATPTPHSPSKEHSQPFVVCPSTAYKTIPAHTNEGTCLRFDRHDSTIFATASIGGSVKTWNATTGASCSVFYCMPGQAILSCDVSRSIVAGAGTDKTCRVWDTTTNRMVRALLALAALDVVVLVVAIVVLVALRIVKSIALPAHKSVVAPSFPSCVPYTTCRSINWPVTCTRSRACGYSTTIRIY